MITRQQLSVPLRDLLLKPPGKGVRDLILGTQSPERIVVDFSSPNIAKPFHFGHLRSTLLGNFLANLNIFLGNQVTKLNYIGDWGTQYGLLSHGLSQFGEMPKTIEDGKSALKHLVDIYVKANEEGLKNRDFFNEAKSKFLIIESDPSQLEKWKQIRDISLTELIESYKKLNLQFDIYEFESDYVKSARDIIDKIIHSERFKRFDDGAIVAKVEKNNRIIEVPVQRSDGASLYLTRDIAAAINRKEKFNFDKMLYVVGVDQERHFHCLREIIRNLGYDWDQKLYHVKVGKVLGMSTRSGQFVLLTDIIEAATKKYEESTRNTSTSKVESPEDLENVSLQLALSALFVAELKNPRTKHYEFSWDAVMKLGNRSGINLQTTYARLCSISRKAIDKGLEPAGIEDLNIDGLNSNDARDLVSVLAQMDDPLYRSYISMDASPVVNYIFDLCKAINRARRSDELVVLAETDDSKARTRLTLFEKSRQQLELLIKLIGLKPLVRV